jgi:hypothetical protein
MIINQRHQLEGISTLNTTINWSFHFLAWHFNIQKLLENNAHGAKLNLIKFQSQ